jgi:hypothetical protein
MDAAKERESARVALAQAKAITAAARHDKRGLTDEESVKIKALQEDAEKAIRRSKILSGDLRGDGTETQDGWTELSKAMVRGDRVFKSRLTDFIRAKDVTHAELENDQQSAGIRPLLEDSRGMAGFFPRVQLQPGALTVSEYFIASRGVASGTVERDPMGTGEKAVVDVTIDLDSADARQFAAIVDDLPNQLFESEPALMGVLQTSLGRELEQALDSHILTKIEAAGVPLVSAGSTVVEKLAYAAADIRAAGGNADFALISEADKVAIDLTVADDIPNGYPFGLTIIASPFIASGDGLVADRSAAVLYAGTAKFDVDPFTGFSVNESRVRLEYNALFHVREADKAVLLQAGILT